MLPIIKWSGSKRYQAPCIVDRIPKDINTYFEPFIGGGSVLGEYLERLDAGTFKCKNIICSDTNIDLIGIWNMVKDNPDKFLSEYSKLYNEFSSIQDINGRKAYYNNIRAQYNYMRINNTISEQRYILFNWLLRNCFNGLVRYNKNGEFNTSCHFTRDGIRPDILSPIVYEWNRLLNKFNVEFICCSYDSMSFPYNCITKEDIVYCDPPYVNSDGMYDSGEFNNMKFFDWLRTLPCKYLLSYDGKSGKDDNTFDMPKDLYTEHKYLDSSISAFKKLVKKSVEQIYDSLYIKEI